MKRIFGRVCVACVIDAILIIPGSAAGLSVSPILVDAGPQQNMTITLTNSETRPLNAQVRVFKWMQHNGKEELVATDDVVASPPIMSISAHEEYVVRLQRVSRQDPIGEESYRIVVDELPNPNRQRNGTVAVVVRYLIPAFFFSPDANQGRLVWSTGIRDGKRVIRAENTGDKRIQLTNLTIQSGAGTTTIAKGLAGYVLGHGVHEWPLSPKMKNIRQGTVFAMSDTGAISAPLNH